MVSGFGYDDDGTVLWQLRDNQFVLLEGEYLHVHRPDRSSLGVYDKWEREIFFIRYLATDAVRSADASSAVRRRLSPSAAVRSRSARAGSAARAVSATVRVD